MTWTVHITGKAKRQYERLARKFRGAVNALRSDIMANGPVAHHWPHYGKLKGRPGWHHCHLNKGKPRYVAVWKVTDKTIQLVEIRYVGTHEKADYRKIR